MATLMFSITIPGVFTWTLNLLLICSHEPLESEFSHTSVRKSTPLLSEAWKEQE